MCVRDVRRQAGQSLIEYVLIVSLLAIMVLTLMMMVAPELQEIFTDSVDGQMMGNAAASVSSMLYAAVPEATTTGSGATWGTYTPSLSMTSFSLWGQPVGTRRTVNTTLDADKVSGAAGAVLTVTANDIDFAGEVTVYVNGHPYVLGVTGDNVTATKTLNINPGDLVAGANTIVYEFSNNGGGMTHGFDIDDMNFVLNQ
ncbi:MAG TPA: hypothetical protein PKM88_09500 [bacterium]|nr:hypothetical protein [bacterium]